ncbi:hypothetical protein Dsin_017463 [Dipteronia sinensis]|uniref:Putative plant transposon protein domain-containing protein n=1 Tax=Dipteronia sinensis TaxID=43782 RepID=A0AAE0AGA6_9ROSI|nr:hypothetical protein Dsin_017463 [Dipteronia sinensis]
MAGGNIGKQVARDGGRPSKKRRTPNMAALELVGEFYYAMVPYQFFQGVPFMVQGREVQITASRFNLWFNAPENLGNLVDSLLDHEHFEPYNGQLAAYLRMGGDPIWNEYHFLLSRNQLKIDATFWYLFFWFSLAPSTHRTDLGYDVARFLYCARNGLRIDIGQIIMKHIFKGRNSTKGGGWTMFPPMTNIRRNFYNDLVKHRGIRLLEDQSDEDYLDDDPVDLDYNE